jgi:hypothetical protein
MDKPIPYPAGTRTCDLMIATDPTTGDGVKAPIGSHASMGLDLGVFYGWVKTGAGDNDWTPIEDFFVPPAPPP